MLFSFEKDIDNNRTLKKTIDGIFSDKQTLESLKKEIPNLDHYNLAKTDDGAIEGEIVSGEENPQQNG